MRAAMVLSLWEHLHPFMNSAKKQLGIINTGLDKAISTRNPSMHLYAWTAMRACTCIQCLAGRKQQFKKRHFEKVEAALERALSKKYVAWLYSEHYPMGAVETRIPADYFWSDDLASVHKKLEETSSAFKSLCVTGGRLCFEASGVQAACKQLISSHLNPELTRTQLLLKTYFKELNRNEAKAPKIPTKSIKTRVSSFLERYFRRLR